MNGSCINVVWSIAAPHVLRSIARHHMKRLSAAAVAFTDLLGDPRSPVIAEHGCEQFCHHPVTPGPGHLIELHLEEDPHRIRQAGLLCVSLFQKRPKEIGEGRHPVMERSLRVPGQGQAMRLPGTARSTEAGPPELASRPWQGTVERHSGRSKSCPAWPVP